MTAPTLYQNRPKRSKRPVLTINRSKRRCSVCKLHKPILGGTITRPPGDGFVCAECRRTP